MSVFEKMKVTGMDSDFNRGANKAISDGLRKKEKS